MEPYKHLLEGIKGKELLSITETCAYLGIGKVKFYDMQKNDASFFPVVNLGGRTRRVRRKDVDLWIKNKVEDANNV